MAPKPISLPLCEKISLKNNLLNKAIDFIISILLLSILVHRLLYLTKHGFNFIWLLALLCESFSTLNWLLILNAKSTPVFYKPQPQNLLQRVAESELPPVDMFVTTADPVLEPPIITVNTALSLMALDYPPNKLACYVSDDGYSPITFYSLIEASKFARLWVPFCKKYNVQVRAPFRYFSAQPAGLPSNAFFEWKKLKDEYEKLERKVEDAMQGVVPLDFSGDFAAFSEFQMNNHPTIIKVIWENKERVDNKNGFLPHLIYVSREKRPNHPHHYKAGAMNVLTRVSGVMTNAPFMLNVDCDMFVNNPKIVVYAMCALLGYQIQDSAFVQFPQVFYSETKDDAFGNQMILSNEVFGRGMSGIQGPAYYGTGCFHRRNIIYGSSPNNAAKVTREAFGNSLEFIRSAEKVLSGLDEHINKAPQHLSSDVETASKVAAYDYERNTAWGTKVGWMYGTSTEDVLTGLVIHTRGWKSVLLTPEPPGFLGSAPPGGPAFMVQRKRWGRGLLEVLCSKYSPILATFNAKLQFRQSLAYTAILIWPLRSIFELCYALLPAYCILTNSHFLPMVHEPAIIIYTAPFLIQNLNSIYGYLKLGLSVRSYWNCLRMDKIVSFTAFLFGIFSFVSKVLGISEMVFEVTKKVQSPVGDVTHDQENDIAPKFTFDGSPIFIPGVTVLFVHLAALAMGLWHGAGLCEYVCSLWVVLCFWPFLMGLFEKEKYGIPWSTKCKSAVLAFIFVNWCRRTCLS